MARNQTFPTFRELSPQECVEIISRNRLGRIAFSFHDAVDIRPISYAYDKGWIFGRTSPGDKLETLRHNQWVAFEVDEIAGAFDWVSVIARGSFYTTGPEGSMADMSFHEHAMTQINRASPEAFTAEDPTGFRTEVFAIHVDLLTGRSCSTEE
jgi:nitroimidazol reductase NimA-like FMN-containing flavoprotein (pyridoxamine 5'-phosphate oxidase superfamily)